jgi:hypothetical protein
VTWDGTFPSICQVGFLVLIDSPSPWILGFSWEIQKMAQKVLIVPLGERHESMK